MAPLAELLLYEAARAQHVAELIRPALEGGAIVLCDRFFDSTTAYQGAGRGIAMEFVMDLHRIATGGIAPDLTFLFDLPAIDGMGRVHGRGQTDRIEQESIDFHEAVRGGFLEIAAANPDRIRIVDATQDIDTIAAQVQAETQRRFAGTR
jgi:dTMP kinase